MRTLQTRITKLEASGPEAAPYAIAGETLAECRELLADAEAKGLLKGRKPLLVVTGVPSAR